METADSTSSSLLSRVKARDPQAWQRLAELYGPLVYQWCRRCEVAPEDAADLVQDVFDTVAGHVGEFAYRRPGDSFRAWVRTVTLNRVRDHFRRLRHQVEAKGGTDAQRRLLEIPDRASLPAHDGPFQDALWQRVLDAVRAEFEDRTWQAFWQVVIDGRAPADVAADLGMTLGAVYKAKARILRRVRVELEGLDAAE